MVTISSLPMKATFRMKMIRILVSHKQRFDSFVRLQPIMPRFTVVLCDIPSSNSIRVRTESNNFHLHINSLPFQCTRHNILIFQESLDIHGSSSASIYITSCTNPIHLFKNVNKFQPTGRTRFLCHTHVNNHWGKTVIKYPLCLLEYKICI